MKQESAVALAVSLTALLAPTFLVDVVKAEDENYVVSIDHNLDKEQTR